MVNMPTSNPWIRYADALTLTEKITDASNKEKQSAQSKSDLFYWDGIEEGARTMRIDLEYLAVSTPQPPSAEMVEARTLGWVAACIDAIIEKALNSGDEQAPGVMLLGLKTLRVELRKKQDKLPGD